MQNKITPPLSKRPTAVRVAPLADETPSDLAARSLGNASAFREILNLNPELDPFLPILQSAAAGTVFR
jgi:hypothetical protein